MNPHAIAATKFRKRLAAANEDLHPIEESILRHFDGGAEGGQTAIDAAGGNTRRYAHYLGRLRKAGMVEQTQHPKAGANYNKAAWYETTDAGRTALEAT